MRWTSARVVGLAVIAGLVGSVAGPPIARAASSVVKVASGSTSKQLRIASGRAFVDTEASTGGGCLGSGSQCLDVEAFALTSPFGSDVMKTGTAAATACTSAGIVNGVVIDRPTGGGSTTVTVTGDTDRNGTAGDLLWQGTASGTGHLGDTFDGAVFTAGPIAVTTTDANATWFLYGICFAGLSQGQIRQVLQHAHR
jgi:hypothetical protein